MSEENDLPEGWCRTTLGEICSKPQYGWTTKANSKIGQVRLLRTTDISSGLIDWNSVPFCTEIPEKLAAYRLNRDDIVISRAGSVGVSYLLSDVPYETVFASYLIRFRPLEGIEPRYMAYYLQTPTYWASIYEQSSGIALANVNARKLQAFDIPLAPVAEQHRIVSAIEQQFTRLDAGVAALKRAQAKLKRYRAAVLKAAVEGKLTEVWRAEHPTTEPASILLERILNERRAKWEDDLRVKGKVPAKVKYIEPAKPDTENLPELPEGWCWATVEQLAAAESRAITDGPFGSNLKTEHYRSNGKRVIRLQNIGDGIFNDEKAFIAPEHFEKLSKHQVFADDLVIAALGDNPPRSCIVPGFVGPAIVKADCIRFKVSPYALNSFINGVLNAEPTRKRTASLIHGIGRPRLNLSEIKSIIVPLPPFSEQQSIMAEVEQHLSVIIQLEAIVEANLKRAERLRQSILKEAFAGRLVPQDANDEPASVLLERILIEREGRKKGIVGNGLYAKVSSEPVKIDVEEARQVELWEGVGG